MTLILPGVDPKLTQNRFSSWCNVRDRRSELPLPVSLFCVKYNYSQTQLLLLPALLLMMMVMMLLRMLPHMLLLMLLLMLLRMLLLTLLLLF